MLGSLPRLSSLSLRFQKYGSLPPAYIAILLANCTHLTHLTLCVNRYDALSQISSLRNLVELSVRPFHSMKKDERTLSLSWVLPLSQSLRLLCVDYANLSISPTITLRSFSSLQFLSVSQMPLEAWTELQFFTNLVGLSVDYISNCSPGPELAKLLPPSLTCNII